MKRTPAQAKADKTYEAKLNEQGFKQVKFRLSPQHVAMLDNLAEQAGVKRVELLRQWIEKSC